MIESIVARLLFGMAAIVFWAGLTVGLAVLLGYLFLPSAVQRRLSLR